MHRGANMREAVYLGDGLYVALDGYQIELFAHNGVEKTNRVFLDKEALSNFKRWLDMMRNEW
jgi:hypothetical protein